MKNSHTFVLDDILWITLVKKAQEEGRSRSNLVNRILSLVLLSSDPSAAEPVGEAEKESAS